MKPSIKDIVKTKLKNIMDVGFIYPIFDSEWVSPLVVVPKKNGKWRICVDCRVLNKDTRKGHFPLPFIDQVLDTLSRNKYFSFVDGCSGYNQIQIHLDDQDKTTSTCPWGTFHDMVLPFVLSNAPTTFQSEVLSIFSNFVHDRMEIYMAEFTPDGETFYQALTNLDKDLKRCIEMSLCFSHEKCIMLSEYKLC